jgi:hypothetical protein
MAAGRYSFEIEKGADFQRTITWLAGESMTPVNTSGYTGLLQVRKSPSSPDILLELSSTPGSDGSIDFGGADGTITLEIDSTVTSALSWSGRAYYDLLVWKDAVETRLLEGRVGLSPAVTRP